MLLIESLDEARRAVAASASLNLCMAKLDKWGFEPPTQFLVVAIPAQAEPELNSLVDKSDGEVYGAFIANYEVFNQFGRDGMRVVESASGRGQKAFLHEWSRTMLETLPPYPEEDYPPYASTPPLPMNPGQAVHSKRPLVQHVTNG